METYEGDENLNYDDLNSGDIGEIKGYGSCSSCSGSNRNLTFELIIRLENCMGSWKSMRVYNTDIKAERGHWEDGFLNFFSQEDRRRLVARINDKIKCHKDGMENKTFEVKLWIKDKESEKIIELGERKDLEVRWKGDRGKLEKEVVFKKDGKDYRILVKAGLKKYLLGTREVVRRWKFLVPSNAPYEIYRGYMGEPNNSPEKDRERQELVILANEWNWGLIAVFYWYR